MFTRIFGPEQEPQTLKPDSFVYGTTKEVAEKPEFFEGDGLQAVRNCFAVNAALAAEGAIFRQSRLFPQPVESCADTKRRGPGPTPDFMWSWLALAKCMRLSEWGRGVL
jgi:hypothetical protein